MKCVVVGLTLLVGMTAAAHGQSSGPATPSQPVHPGTAILDSMGIFAGEQASIGRPVHPGTAILDSMGIFAGMPVLDPKTNRNAVAESTVTPE